jgi:hypothetical protein
LGSKPTTLTVLIDLFCDTVTVVVRQMSELRLRLPARLKGSGARQW